MIGMSATFIRVEIRDADRCRSHSGKPGDSRAAKTASADDEHSSGIRTIGVIDYWCDHDVSHMVDQGRGEVNWYL
jgi:hypothetical protein